jgi:hypothetical protein
MASASLTPVSTHWPRAAIPLRGVSLWCILSPVCLPAAMASRLQPGESTATQAIPSGSLRFCAKSGMVLAWFLLLGLALVGRLTGSR